MGTKDMLKNLADFAMAKAREMRADVDPNELVPAVFMVSENGAVDIAVMPWRSDEEKAVTIALLRQKMLASSVAAYAIVSEAWVIHRPAEEGVPDERPSEAEDRMEVITVSAGDRAGQNVSMTSKIVRDADGAFVTTGDPDVMSGCLGGMMANLLAPQQTAH